jgi:hypothetical protein
VVDVETYAAFNRAVREADPAPIPLEEMQRTFDWPKSWGMLETTAAPVDLVNLELQAHAHPVA